MVYWAKVCSCWDLHVTRQSCQWKTKVLHCRQQVSEQPNVGSAMHKVCKTLAKNYAKCIQRQESVNPGNFEASERFKPLKCICSFCRAINTLTFELTHTDVDARKHIFHQGRLNRPCPISSPNYVCRNSRAHLKQTASQFHFKCSLSIPD